MKIRNGFISNSSSSSFIIAYKEHVCPTCNHNNVSIINNIKHSCDIGEYNYELKGEGKDNVISKFKEEYYIYDDNDKKNRDEIIEKINNINDDMNVIYCTINHGNTIGELELLNDGKNLVILYMCE